jgi:hypothetical protein
MEGQIGRNIDLVSAHLLRPADIIDGIDGYRPGRTASGKDRRQDHTEDRHDKTGNTAEITQKPGHPAF